MALRKILPYGTPSLRGKAKEVHKFSKKIQSLITDLLDTMYANNGVGLAAPQVGEEYRIFVIDTSVNDEPLNPIVFVNPKIIKKEGAVACQEGCLSFPDIRGKVVRPWGVKVKYTGLDGVERERDLWGFMARAAQHEIDHLGGTLFIDHFSHVKKLAVKGKLRRLQEQTQAEMGR